MPSDDKLAKLSYEIDDFIAQLIKKYDYDSLTITAVILARIVLANEFSGSGDDFRKLMANVPDTNAVNKELH